MNECQYLLTKAWVSKFEEALNRIGDEEVEHARLSEVRRNALISQIADLKQEIEEYENENDEEKGRVMGDKWECNVCTTQYEDEKEAALCHPDIVRVRDAQTCNHFDHDWRGSPSSGFTCLGCQMWLGTDPYSKVKKGGGE